METITYEWRWRIAKKTPLKTWLTRARFFSTPPWDQVALIRCYPPLWLDYYNTLPKDTLYLMVWRKRISRCNRLRKADLAEICAYLML
jgi:hypothetical protein